MGNVIKVNHLEGKRRGREGKGGEERKEGGGKKKERGISIHFTAIIKKISGATPPHPLNPLVGLWPAGNTSWMGFGGRFATS